jgi:3-oxoacyl-[acyl-carrier-protein] synthase II
VSAFGVGREVFWDAVSRGVSGTRAVTEFDVSHCASRVAAAVPDAALDAADGAGVDPGEDAERDSGRADPRRYAKVSRIAVLAAREALADAGLSGGARGTGSMGVIVGSGAGGIDVAERQYREYYAGAYHRISPYAIPVSIVGIVSSEISIALGLHGISHVLSTGCTSSTDAIGYAASLIRSGEADVLVTGGADACVTPGMLFGFSRMRAVATHFNDRPAEASRPFDRGRDGFVLGEGAWLMTVESEAHARARGARIYAYVDGYASTCDAYHRVQMDPDGTEIVRAMTEAMARAGRGPADIGYVNFHGTSTMLNDAVEARCVARVLADAPQIVGSSTKSMIGHPQGASGAAGVVATALAMARGVLPPTINLTDPDPALGDIDFIANVPRPARIDAALCNCLGFGSKNSALVLGRAD